MVDVIVERCAGLDVHRDTVVATVRLPGKGKSRSRRLQETRTFGTTIGHLERLSDWLAECGVTRVGMESTGCYWKSVYDALEDGSIAGSSTPNTCGTSPAARAM